MGQQQLLLIVLGVIIVGIAVVVGINLFNANAETSTQDSIVSQGTNIGAMAQQYYKKPKAMGGGGGSFANFETDVFDKLPEKLINSTDAEWAVTSADSLEVVLEATPHEYSEWSVQTTVNKDEIISQIQ